MGRKRTLRGNHASHSIEHRHTGGKLHGRTAAVAVNDQLRDVTSVGTNAQSFCGFAGSGVARFVYTVPGFANSGISGNGNSSVFGGRFGRFSRFSRFTNGFPQYHRAPRSQCPSSHRLTSRTGAVPF